MTNIHKDMEKLIGAGFAVIPLETHGKKPHKGYEWKEQNLALENLQNVPSTCNVGVVLGERSNGLVDLDFDILEAGIIANKIFSHLPGFGRKSAPYGHKIVRCAVGKTHQFGLTKDQAKLIGLHEDEKTMVLELRSNGAYTMFPGSTHPSGELVSWNDGFPENIPEMEFNELYRLVGICAFLAVILRMYPKEQGTRDTICLALAGTLLRADIAPEVVDDLIVFIAEQKGDNEAQDRRKAYSTKEKLDAGEEVTGLPVLCELLGITELKPLLSKWLYGSSLLPIPAETEKVIAELNERFFVVENDGGKCRVAFFSKQPLDKDQTRDVLTQQTFEDFKKRFMNRTVVIDIDEKGNPKCMQLGRYWLEHPDRRQYEQIEFMPGMEAPPHIFNLWKGFAYQAKKGSWSRMLRHIWRVLARRNKQAFRYIIFWAAWSVQNMREPAEVALVFRGGKGTGKGTFCRWLKKLFGQHGMQIFSSKLISGQFNTHLRDCVLLFADEAITPNNKEAENILKGILTEPTIPIEGKGKDVIQVPNHLHIVMASNADWIVPASADERRFAVFDVSDEVSRDKNWFGPLIDEMENGGAEAMLYFLQNLDIGDWHPRDSIPANRELNDQRIHSLHGFDDVWFNWLYSGETTVGNSEEVRIRIATADFADTVHKANLKAAGDYLKAMGCKHDRNTRPTTWIVPPLPEARQIWDTKRFAVDWDQSEHWLNAVKPDDEPL